MERSTKTGSHLVNSRGFTLIELLVVLAVLAILGAMVVPQYLDRAQDAREAVLRDNLYQTRKVIDQFYRDHGRYPQRLDELVALRYLRDLPTDPITGRKDAWALVKPEGLEGVIDLRSTAAGKGRDGTAYAQW
jgi:general secretion pathway protein G